MGLSLRDFRARITISNAEVRRQNVATALKLKDKGYSNTAIGKRMGINESSVRSLLDPTLQKRSERTMVTANILEDLVKEKKYIDVGKVKNKWYNRYPVESCISYSKTKRLQN